ncbi:hypothetical protein GGX14DRAFT_545962 [Mycena pura]|uniref:G domain-containing protein n=1 Tax=Mycena pura TaxID=153505 RepID=A0AAD6Y3N4_9AGAR|nr:hypothetical protein GGX14DRAFT_545962 [Mycena pura]
MTSPPLVSREIVEEYHRFRILVVGKAGVGKSSLIHYAFGVTTTISDERRGECNIDDELVSEQNHLFVLHDSMGFEPGQEKNLEEAKQFLHDRSGSQVSIHKRVHAIWLCIQTPHAGGRVFETGDEIFLKLAASKNIPIVVVFTQFDKLFNKYLLAPNAAPNGNFSDSKFRARCFKSAEAELEKNCVKPLKKVSPKVPHARTSGLGRKDPSQDDMAAVANVIALTRDLLEKDGSLVWVMSAMAQRASADTKIKASIDVVLHSLTTRVGYWSGLAAGAKFLGWNLETCIDTLHSEIIATWNFLDDDNLLKSLEFVEEIKKLVQFVVPGESPSETTSWFGQNLDKVYKLVGITATVAAAAAGPIAPIAVPTIAGVGLSVLFVAYLSKAYQSTPETLRCLMAYIVDLTLIMEELFHIALACRPVRKLTTEDIGLAVKNYVESHAEKVHSEIRSYTKASKLSNILRSRKAEDEVKSLIAKYRRGDQNSADHRLRLDFRYDLQLPRSHAEAHVTLQQLIFHWDHVVPMARFVYKVSKCWRWFGHVLPTEFLEDEPPFDGEYPDDSDAEANN